MKTNYGIKNFRVFDEEGDVIQLSPITIITGRNSAGKSSIVKSILLLNSFLEKIKADYHNQKKIDLKNYTFDFRQYPNNTLGRYDRVVNHHAEGSAITFSFSTYSTMLSQEVTVELTFDKDSDDVLNNGYLQEYKIKDENGEVLYSSGNGQEIYCDVIKLQKIFAEFAIVESLWDIRVGLESAYEVHNISKEEYEEQRKLVKSIATKFPKKLQEDVMNRSFTVNNYQTIVEKTNWPQTNDVRKKLNWLEWTVENNSLYNIPVVELLSKDDKDAIIKKVEEKLASNKADEKTCFAVKKVLASFMASDCTTLLEYQKSLENVWFSSDTVNRKHTFLPFERKSLSTNYFIAIPQDYLFLLQNAGLKATKVNLGEGDSMMLSAQMKLYHPDSIKRILIKRMSTLQCSMR